jgi:hypothetical protein
LFLLYYTESTKARKEAKRDDQKNRKIDEKNATDAAFVLMRIDELTEKVAAETKALGGSVDFPANMLWG